MLLNNAIALLPFIILPLCAAAQLSATTESTPAQLARSRYYNLEAAGFQGFKCAVDFDFSTVPLLSANPGDETRNLLKRTRFTLEVDEKGRPTVQHLFPTDASETGKVRATQVLNLLTSFVSGVFSTWPSKGLEGPIPPFDSQIEGIVAKKDGYIVSLRVPGAPVQVEMDKSYNVTAITSAGGKLVEHPIYTPFEEGLVFTANRAIDNTNASGQVQVMYELGNAVVEGLRIPKSVHLRVNDNIDVNYMLSECSVKKAKVVHLSLPRTNTIP